MAKIIKVDGNITELDKNPTLEEAQAIVGGYIEMHPYQLNLPGGGDTIVLDEEGRLKHKPVNNTASTIVGYEVVGDVILMKGDLDGDEDEDEEEMYD